MIRWLWAVPALLPVAAGLIGTALPSLGWMPGLDQTGLSLGPWRALLGWPGLAGSVLLTIRVGFSATALSLASALLLAALARSAPARRRLQAVLPPLLATPHVALAIGFAFLIAPSGWLARLASPWLTGWRAPPDVAIVHDAAGVSLILGLWLKETPYLLLVILAALAQVPEAVRLRAAAALGYAPWRGWILAILPPVWVQVRLPVMAVLAFSLSVVDVALVLGPGSPPPLAVQLLRWFDDPDLSRWLVACAGAVLLAGIVAASILAMLALEALARRSSLALLRHGRRGGSARLGDGLAALLGTTLAAVGILAGVVLLLWAGAGAWRFPAALPQAWSAESLSARLGAQGGAALNTLWLALASAALALLLAIAGLCSGARPRAWLFVPLLVPQPAFLWGQQVLLARLRLDGGAFALVWAHLVFVLPYVVLSLADPWRALDPRFARAAASLGAPPWRVLLRVRLPLLAGPLLAAFAIGFAVSVGLYLPTIFAGAGRLPTLATEAVALASGPDRPAAAAAALAQAALPLAAFALALTLPGRRRAAAQAD